MLFVTCTGGEIIYNMLTTLIPGVLWILSTFEYILFKEMHGAINNKKAVLSSGNRAMPQLFVAI